MSDIMGLIYTGEMDTRLRELTAVRAIAAQEGVAESGFRVVSNCGRDGAQSVNHLHVHLLGGAALTERMA